MRGSNPPPEIGNLKLISNSQNKVTEKSTDHLQPLENTPPPLGDLPHINISTITALLRKSGK